MAVHAFRESISVLAGSGTGGLPAAVTASADGVTIDMRGYNEGVLDVFVPEVGTAGGALDASNKWHLIVEHADESTVTPDTAGTFVAATAEDLLFRAGSQETVHLPLTDGSFAIIDAAAEDLLLYSVGYKGKKAYVRFRPVATGSPGSTTFVAIWRKCRAHRIPAT